MTKAVKHSLSVFWRKMLSVTGRCACERCVQAKVARAEELEDAP